MKEKKMDGGGGGGARPPPLLEDTLWLHQSCKTSDIRLWHNTF